MVSAAVIILVVSLIAITCLFAFKSMEIRRGRIMLPGVHRIADTQALEVKKLLYRGRRNLSRIPPLANYIARLFVHEGALSFAALARSAERQAHRLADFVSQKHRFERRETRSEFLKKMSKEHPTRETNSDASSTDSKRVDEEF